MKRRFVCSDCGYSWDTAFGTGRPEKCPECGSTAIHRDHETEGNTAPGPGHGFRRSTGGGGRGACGAGRPGRAGRGGGRHAAPGAGRGPAHA
ncbi:hypothetical protein INT08_08355 [Prosthecochloris sp. N3]|uniref:Rubredoxin-like domain-containing protein n=1 Tax=Prosthecochloris ethylica TaxID=2743976 RepID=A0ABR9XTN9_9CHLB|nr:MULTISPECIES: hypothetical protein [Prosthecochloris]MBF0586943.1 hypothetical protein [Prosthecochloris ethylica]MBF0637180.1 hypothetical protein [Prosthecochloris ethylica]NUK48188.1 hypothetical protein [Prosthecochloris ethylica]